MLVEVLPSPNAHNQPVGKPVDVSANWTVTGAIPVKGVAVKNATGAVPLITAGETMIGVRLVKVLLPDSLLTVRDTEYVPIEYKTFGFDETVVLYQTPSPTLQFHIVPL